MSQYPHACLMQATGARRRCEAEALVNVGLYSLAAAMMEEAAVYIACARDALPESALSWRAALDDDLERLHEAHTAALYLSGYEGQC